MATAQHWPLEQVVETPWEKMDCRAAVRWAYAQCGIDLPEDALEHSDPGYWECVGNGVVNATRPLDVIASDPRGTGWESHVSVLLRASAPRLALTSALTTGVVALRPWGIRRVLGVYRWRGGVG